MKRYRAVFFDWDGTAVRSRKAPADDVIAAMRPLLQAGVCLAIISGTTLENIGGGKLHDAFSPLERRRLFYGLARGAVNLRFDDAGKMIEFASGVPPMEKLLRMHDACFRMHQWLLETYGLPTDIVFSRPNYCKLDLMAASSRGDQLFMHKDELGRLEALLAGHGLVGGLQTLIAQAEAFGRSLGLSLCATSDAKYLEIGLTIKSHNADAIFGFLSQHDGLTAKECCYWGDEYIRIGDGVYGSDSYMITDQTRGGDFFDVSDMAGERPTGVIPVGGGVDGFLSALRELHRVWAGGRPLR